MIYILIGFISGIFSGTGMGGGTILILLLIFFMQKSQYVAQATNLIFFIPTSIGATLVNIKNKNINYKVVFIVSFFGVLGSIIGVMLATKINLNILKKIFGIFLAIIAINETHEIFILYIKRRKEE